MTPASKRRNLAERPPPSLGARNADGTQVGGGSFGELPVDAYIRSVESSDEEGEDGDATAMSEEDEQDEGRGSFSADDDLSG